MHLRDLLIWNCFGFGKATVDLQPDLVFVLGRNSSGKTALLDAINNVAPARFIEDHPRFANFRPTETSPQITATFTVAENPKPVDMKAALLKPLLARGLSPQALDQSAQLQDAIAQIVDIYDKLFDEIGSNGTLRVIKWATRQCQLTVGDNFNETIERRQRIANIIRPVFPSGVFTVAGTNHPITPPTPSDLDRVAGEIIPRISYFNERYSITEDLPDHFTAEIAHSPPNNLTKAFAALLGTETIATLLATNDPDEQNELRAEIQARVDTLATTISNESNRLVQITLSSTSRGLEITMRTDRKKSFYRQMSDATKFLVAYHIYAHNHEPGDILLFDEPSRGLHASAESYLREFLQRLASENHVIVSTHSERLIDLDRLDGIRLMQQDDDDRLVVLNSFRPPRNRENYLLALQPIFDAIGLAHVNQTLTNNRAMLTEGLTDYLYLRSFLDLMSLTPTFGIAPGRGESTIFTLAPFMASQGVSIKIILDHPHLKAKLQEAYGIPENAFFVIPGKNRTRGIEDMFTPGDYLRLLTASGHEVQLDDLIKAGNSAYAKDILKRLVAQDFRNQVPDYPLEGFEDETRANISSLLEFCSNDSWFTI